MAIKFIKEKWKTVTMYHFIVGTHELKIFTRNKIQTGFLCGFDNKIIKNIEIILTKRISQRDYFDYFFIDDFKTIDNNEQTKQDNSGSSSRSINQGENTEANNHR